MEHNLNTAGLPPAHDNLNPAEQRYEPRRISDSDSVAVIDTPAHSPPPETAMAGKTKPRKGSSPMKAVRYEDAADAAPPVVVGKVPKPSEKMRDVRDHSADGRGSSSASVRSGSGNSSAKMATLRATFEKGTGGVPKDRNSGGSFSSVKRRFTSSDKLEVPNGKGSHALNGAEMARLEEDLNKERELCQAYVDKCAMLEEEAVKLRHVYDEKCTFLIEEADHKQHSMHREAEQQRAALDQKYAALADKAQERRDTFEERYAVLEREVQELRTKVQQPSESESQATSPYSERSSVERSRLEDAGEIMVLRRQLADLKRNISMSTRMDGQVTDSVFAQETGVVHHEIQNWVVNNFRRAKADVTPQEMRLRLDEVELTPGQRHQLRPMYAAYDPSMKLVMYQATAVCLFMDIFNDESLYGLPEDLPWRQALREAVNKLEHILGPAAHNKWRAVTVDVIRQSDGMQTHIEAAARTLAEKVCTVLTVLTQVEGNGTRLAAVTELQHLFRVQRARYQFDLPSTSDLFYSEVMENISVDIDTPIDSRVVRCATFPSVMKIGDELGDNVHLTNVIVKAKVVCS
ncbi:hypothetical protein LTR42_004708 [Elasticomyces elasticus]|nr:hypothetical protein LTR42_004708 [Elasticomyces elasticus]